MMTIIFVMLAEVLIFMPSLAQFRLDFLRERLDRAQIASLALEASPDFMVDPTLERELLSNAEVLNVVFRRDTHRELILQSPMLRPVNQEFNLAETDLIRSIPDAIRCLLSVQERIIRVIGTPSRADGLQIEVTIDEITLRNALRAYGQRVFLVSLVISLMTAIFLFLAVRYFITGPIVAVAQNMTRFRENPEDPSLVIEPTSRTRELADAEIALQDMQSKLIKFIRQKDRLAALGGAVARVNHDLRNMLTTAQLFADRIEMSHDPKVSRAAPKLIAALDRAIALCQQTLDFGKSEEPLPERRLIDFRTLVDDIAESERLHISHDRIEIVNDVPESLTIDADPEQMYRVLGNLVRNARQALERDQGHGRIRITAAQSADGFIIDIEDSGPGLPSLARENLFKAFSGRGTPGGSGLGLAISAELVSGHGGTLELAESSPKGTRFRISLPGRAQSLRDQPELGSNISPLHTANRPARHHSTPRR